MFYEDAYYVSAGKFTSPENWIHPSRNIDTNVVIYVTGGTLYLCGGYNEYTLKKGDAIILKKELRHYGFAPSAEPVSFYFMHFRTEDSSSGINDGGVKAVTLSDEGRAAQLFEQLLCYSDTVDYPQSASDYLVRLILIELCVQHSYEKEKRPALINDICAWVRSNRGKNIKVSDVASNFRYNEDYIARFFKQYYPKGLKNYLDVVKMSYIKEMLIKTEYPLKEIALLAGFEDYKYFLKFFTYHEKTTPSQFRELYYNTDIKE